MTISVFFYYLYTQQNRPKNVHFVLKSCTFRFADYSSYIRDVLV